MRPLPEPVRARIPFTACLQAFTEPENVPDFWSSALQAKSAGVKYGRGHIPSHDFIKVNFSVAVKMIKLKCISCVFSFRRTSRFASFPEYLVVQIKKFTFGVDWVPKKLGNYRKVSRTSNHF